MVKFRGRGGLLTYTTSNKRYWDWVVKFTVALWIVAMLGLAAWGIFTGAAPLNFGKNGSPLLKLQALEAITQCLRGKRRAEAGGRHEKAFSLAVALAVLGGCASAMRRSAGAQAANPPGANELALPPALQEPLPTLPLPGLKCLPYAMSAMCVMAPNSPEFARRECAFRNYYEAYLDAKEQAKYVGCLRRRWAVPWLHADYRRARRWLKTSQAEVARYGPLAGADRRITDVKESFEPQGPGTTLRRLTITFASGKETVVDSTFSDRPSAR
ncbi:MAG: hypothetical protein KGL04_06380 [Elusimicrobia bacterium]|nr:hypothetical protein [Elusimicrobiota bacterium]